MKFIDLEQNQNDKTTVLNLNFKTADHITIGCYEPLTTGGLTFGYKEGRAVNDSGVSQYLNSGTKTLVASSINYIEYDSVTNAIQVNQTDFTDGKVSLYKVTTNSTSITNIEKHKTEVLQKKGVSSGGGVSLGNAIPLVDSTGSAGSAISASREDHVHPLTPVATTSSDGLMSSIDKTKLDGISGTSGVSKIIAGNNITISPVGGTGDVTINASGSSSVATAEVFSVTAKTGLIATIQGGKCANIGGRGLYNNINSLQTVPTTNVTLPANSSGFVVYRTGSGGSIGYVTTANLASEVLQPLFYFATSATTITTFEDVRKSFSKFNMNNPVIDLIQTTWAVSSSYSFSVSFPDMYRAITPLLANILCERIQLLCVTAELGYSANDITCAVANEPSVVISPGNVKILTQPALPQILNRTTLGTISTITPANWKLLVTCKTVM